MSRASNLNEEKIHIKSPGVLGVRYIEEEPPYEMLEKDGEFEIRSYEAQVRASVTISNSSFNDFHENAFKALAAYFDHYAIGLEAPVLLSQRDSESWTMSFILPQSYSMDSVPHPLNPEIDIAEIKPTLIAVYSYSGNNTIKKFEHNTKKLLTWLESNPKYEPSGEYFFAQYDAPYLIPFSNKNEIHASIKPVYFV